MIEEAGVAATPGLDFGHHLPRATCASPRRAARLLEAAERIRRARAGALIGRPAGAAQACEKRQTLLIGKSATRSHGRDQRRVFAPRGAPWLR